MISRNGTKARSGPSWVAGRWPYWVALVVCVLLGLAHLQSSREQQRSLAAVERLHHQATPVNPVDGTALLLDMRRLLPQLGHVDGLQAKVDVLERRLRSRPASGALTRETFSELDAVRGQMLTAALTEAATNARSNLWLALLLSLLGMGALGRGLVRGRADKSANRELFGDAAEMLFHGMPAAAVLTDPSDRILRVNNAYERMTGYSEAEVVGQDIAFNHAGQQDAEFYLAMRERLRMAGTWSGEFWLRNKAGEAFADKVSRLRLMSAAADRGFLTISQDVVTSDDAKRLMLWQAHHDTLTKLPNRNLFAERTARVLVREGSHTGALISIDLDRFKILNDSEGPATGDQLLMEAGVRIAMCVRESDTVARLGGDHFVVLLPEVEDYAEVERIARAVVDAVAQPFQSDSREIYMTASVGVAMIPDDGRETGELLQKADAARIQVKEQGGNGVAFFEPDMNARAERRVLLESELRRAIAAGDLELHFQPIVDVKRGTVAAAEALLRWPHAEMGMISPAEFIPVAEDSGLIVEVGEWVLAECQQRLVDWRDRGLDRLRLSLNVSAVQIRSEANADRLLAGLRRGNNDGIVLELTESALIHNREGVQKFLRDVRELGCQVALDDFGTGFSSLAYLREFEFDTLKIDKTFIDELANPRDYGLVASIVSLGRILGMRVVAEGVETAEQAQQLRQIGCDFIQGYFYSRPLPVTDFYDFVSDTQLRRVV